MAYRIRRMTLRNYDAVFALWRETPGVGLDADSDSRAAIGRHLKRNPGLSFVACVGGRIVGAVLSGHDGRRGYLHHLAVAETHRRQGIGQALVSRCLAALARRHIPKCNIFVLRTNASGIAFWLHQAWLRREQVRLLQKLVDAQH